MDRKEIDNIRLHVGIRSGYRHIERDRSGELVGAKQFGLRPKPLPRLKSSISRAHLAFQYLSSPLLHDLNRMTVLLNTWEEHLHPVPNKVLMQLVEGMEKHIRHCGGRP